MRSNVDYGAFPDGPLVLYVIKKLGFPFVHPNFEDAFQNGMLELLRCRETWDSSKGTFATYAFKCIRGAVMNAYRDSTEKKAADQWHRRRGLEAPSYAYVSIDLEHSADSLRERSIEVSLEELEDRDDAIDRRKRVQKLLRGLPKREKSVIRAHYFQNQTFEEIATTMGVSRQRVHIIYQRAMKRLQEKAQRIAA